MAFTMQKIRALAHGDSFRSDWRNLGAIIAGLVTFVFLEHVAEVSEAPTYITVNALVLLALPGLTATAGGIPKQFMYLVFAINGCCLFYLLGMHATYQIAGLPLLSSVWVPIAFAVLGFRWPVLVAFPAIAIRWMKLHNQDITSLGAPNSADFVIVPDLALLLSIMISIYALAHWISSRTSHKDFAAETYFNACIVVTAGIHLSNYFYSGWGKLILPNTTPLTWVLHNPTYFLAVHASDTGALTLFNMMADRDLLAPIAVWLNVPLNLFVLAIQLWALVSLLSLRGSAWVTFLYDVMHVGIFLLTGIFFWKWIVLNASFIAAFRSMRGETKPSLRVRLFGCLVVLLAPLTFHIVKLAWLDTGAVNDPHFEVRSDNGEFTRVPSNYFLDKSINVAQGRVVRPTNGFLPTGTWGTVGDGQVMADLARACPEQAHDWTLGGEQKRKLTAMLKLHHQMALRLADERGHVAYDLYPHHIWSAPWLFDDFSQLDIRKIKSYFFVVESRCVTLNGDGSISRKVVGRYRYELNL